MNDVGSSRCQKILLGILTTGRLMGVTVTVIHQYFARGYKPSRRRASFGETGGTEDGYEMIKSTGP